jgi:DnaJ-class molecular chaperone
MPASAESFDAAAEPIVIRFRCCTCAGTGVSGLGDTCADCDGTGIDNHGP